VERWIQAIKQRKDLFGFVDVLAVKDGNTLAIQATTGSNHADRVKKVKASPLLPAVLAAGWIVEVWSWTLAGPKGERKLWFCRKEAIVL
jgi:hypothetical protein